MIEDCCWNYYRYYCKGNDCLCGCHTDASPESPINVGDTVRLMCPIAGAFRGLVRVAKVPDSDGPFTVWAETPILDWLSSGPDDRYPYRIPGLEIGGSFNAEANELEVIP